MYALSKRFSPPSDIANSLVNTIKKTYPGVSNSAKLFLVKNLPGKSDLILARKQIGSYAGMVGNQLKSAKLYLIIGGIAYSVFKSYRYYREVHPIENVSDTIRQKPIKSTLIALGAGFILGRLL